MKFTEEIINTFGAVVGGLILVFLCFLAMLWFLFPFIAYQIRNRLDTLIAEARQIRKNTETQKPK